MSEPKRPPLNEVRREIGRLIAEGRAMVALRGRLARIELRGATVSIRRLLVRIVIAAVLAIVATSLLAVVPYTPAVVPEVAVTSPWTP